MRDVPLGQLVRHDPTIRAGLKALYDALGLEYGEQLELSVVFNGGAHDESLFGVARWYLHPDVRPEIRRTGFRPD